MQQHQHLIQFPVEMRSALGATVLQELLTVIGQQDEKGFFSASIHFIHFLNVIT
jgi:hypothetical protein